MDLEELDERICIAITQAERGSTDSLRRLTQSLGTKESIEGLLISILREESRISESGGWSYIHGNGFDKLVLLMREGVYKLRLHVWWEDAPLDATENIHCHRWDFASTLITGNYRYQLYERTDREGTEEGYEYVYHPPRNEGFHGLKLVGQQRLLCTFDANLAAGSSYYMSRKLFHRITRLGHGMTSTIMLQQRDATDTATMFAKSAYDQPEELHTPPLGSEGFKSQLESYLRALSSQV